MSKIGRLIQQELSPRADSPACQLFFAPAMEARAREVIDRLSFISFESHPLVLSAETQQLDEATKDDIMDAVREELSRVSATQDKTGPVNLFLMEGDKIASGDADAQQVLNAMATSLVQCPEKTVLALLPADHPDVHDDARGSNAPVHAVLQHLAAATEAHVVYSEEALGELLRTLQNV